MEKQNEKTLQCSLFALAIIPLTEAYTAENKRSLFPFVNQSDSRTDMAHTSRTSNTDDEDKDYAPPEKRRKLAHRKPPFLLISSSDADENGYTSNESDLDILSETFERWILYLPSNLEILRIHLNKAQKSDNHRS